MVEFSITQVLQGGGVDWAARHPPLETKKKKNNVDILAEIKAKALDRYLTVISSLWHW